ncbi:hypothetical protein ACS0TY_005001 [Phlomoides rotata]
MEMQLGRSGVLPVAGFFVTNLEFFAAALRCITGSALLSRQSLLRLSPLYSYCLRQALDEHLAGIRFFLRGEFPQDPSFACALTSPRTVAQDPSPDGRYADCGFIYF